MALDLRAGGGGWPAAAGSVTIGAGSVKNAAKRDFAKFN